MKELLVLLLLAVPALAQGDGRTATLHATVNLQSREQVADLLALSETPSKVVCSFYSLGPGCTLAEVRLRYCYLTGSGGTDCPGNHEVIDFSAVAPTFTRAPRKVRVPEATPTPKAKGAEEK